MTTSARLVLYLLCSAAVVATMFAVYLMIVEPEVTRGSATAEFVSPHGRIRIAEVQSFTMSRGSDEQSPNGPTPTLSSVYVPSYLPDGFSHGDMRLLTESSVAQLFEGGDTTLMVVQSPSASLIAKVGVVMPIDVNGRSGFLVHGGWSSFDESAVWDRGKGLTLLLEMDDAMVSLHDEESRLTQQQMVKIADSLERSKDVLASLTKDEDSQYESVVEQMGPGFGSLYVPTYLPAGYSQTTSQASPAWGYTELRYRKLCGLSIHQHSQASPMGPEIARRATFGPSETVVQNGNEIHVGYRTAPHPVRGIQFYVSGPHSLIRSQHWFEHEGAWFNIEVDDHRGCETLSLDEVARIATSLKPIG